MSSRIKHYQFLIRVIGGMGAPILILLSDYHENYPTLLMLSLFYVCISFVERFKKFNFQLSKRLVNYMYYLDVLMLTIAIGVRGGVRSDFYLGYFLILGYVLMVREKWVLTKLSAWIVFCYSGISYIASPPGSVSIGRLLIRLTLLIGTAYLLQKYANDMVYAENSLDNAMKMAFTDPLTNAFNRRMINYICEEEEANNSDRCVALIDLDDFKKINDTYGHDAGDDVIKSLVQVINTHTENKYPCIRYGGEEFLLIFRDLSADDTKTIIEAIREDFAHYHFKWLKDKVEITFTAGLAIANSNQTLEEGITNADKALYLGKASGKNCTIIH